MCVRIEAEREDVMTRTYRDEKKYVWIEIIKSEIFEIMNFSHLMICLTVLWKVFKVIWVAGSPRDWAARTPHISPGWTTAVLKSATIEPTSHFNDSSFNRCSFNTLFVANLDRINIWNNSVALYWASLDRGSLPLTTKTSSSHILLIVR